MEAGSYSKTGKVNLLWAISGDPDNPDIWHEIWGSGETTIFLFVDDIRRIIGDILVLVHLVVDIFLRLIICRLIYIRSILQYDTRLSIRLLREHHIDQLMVRLSMFLILFNFYFVLIIGR